MSGATEIDPLVDDIRRSLHTAGVGAAHTLELATADPVSRLVAITTAQAECIDPLPTELVEVLDSFDDLVAFVRIRESQEEGQR